MATRSLILNLTKENWQNELQDEEISDEAKKILKLALEVKLGGKGKMPAITEEVFNSIITQDVFFVTIGRLKFLLSFSGRSGTLNLVREY